MAVDWRAMTLSSSNGSRRGMAVPPRRSSAAVGSGGGAERQQPATYPHVVGVSVLCPALSSAGPPMWSAHLWSGVGSGRAVWCPMETDGFPGYPVPVLVLVLVLVLAGGNSSVRAVVVPFR